MWLIMAILSAVFASATTILVKCGVKKTDSDIATAIRTIAVLLFSWIMVFLVGSQSEIGLISTKSLIFLVLSGLSTGASWLCCYKALSTGDVNKVIPIDKSSTILTVLFAIILFGETDNLVWKIVFTVVLAVGIYLMVEKKQNNNDETNSKMWIIYALFSALFAAATSILAKIGIKGVESNLGTAIRTIVVLFMAWVVVFVKGKQKMVRGIDKHDLLFIALSGLATGGSWLCYYYAVQNGDLSVVAPIDKMSIVITVIFSYVVFNEKLSKKAFLGLCLMVIATLGMVFTK
ncbi:MAG: EamA family transporter [Lachnospiraceae bacterium]|nr:EamA family transporter [Lachnospiraceae bacterium]